MLIAVAATAVVAPAPERPAAPPPNLPQRTPGAEPAQAQLPGELPTRALTAGRAAYLFPGQSWEPRAAAPQPIVQPPGESTPPPMPYRFVGTMANGDRTEYLLMKEEVVFGVKKGDTLDAAYRVEALTPQEVTLVYVPLDISINLALASPGVGPLREFAAPLPSKGSQNAPLVVAAPVGGSSEGQTAASAAKLSETTEILTAESGTRAAHRRRERMQQLPPIAP